jgi:hypothetical protein
MKIIKLFAFRSMRCIDLEWYEKMEEMSTSRHLLMLLELLKWMGARLVSIEVKTRTKETTWQPEINSRCNL